MNEMPRNKPTQRHKDLDSENHKALLEATKDDTNRWKARPCSCPGRINTGKRAIPPKATLTLSAIPLKSPMAFSTELEQKTSKICMETQNTPNSQRNEWGKGEKNGAGGIRLPDFRPYYKAAVTQTVWHWLKTQHIHRWKRRQVNPSMTKGQE